MERIGKYEIIRQIGSGATSVVYLADDPFTGRKVAIKRVRTEVLGDSDLGQRFRRLFLAEASLAGKLRHPHIVSIYDAEATEQDSYIAMEYVPGGTLEQYCRVDNLLPLARTVELMFKCCKALDFAHRFGVIHRDIKPANILIGDLDEIKISDFGAALSISAETTQVSGVGSPAY
ncbi:MAG: serine/threonine-protein kinase, partial [Betaproteobacteria bacterium]